MTIQIWLPDFKYLEKRNNLKTLPTDRGDCWILKRGSECTTPTRPEKSREGSVILQFGIVGYIWRRHRRRRHRRRLRFDGIRGEIGPRTLRGGVLTDSSHRKITNTALLHLLLLLLLLRWCEADQWENSFFMALFTAAARWFRFADHTIRIVSRLGVKLGWRRSCWWKKRGCCRVWSPGTALEFLAIFVDIFTGVKKTAARTITTGTVHFERATELSAVLWMTDHGTELFFAVCILASVMIRTMTVLRKRFA